MSAQDLSQRRGSAVASLKEIVTLLAAIAFTIGVTTLLTGSDTGSRVRDLASISMFEWMNFSLLLVGLVRFYHGNVRFLDEHYVLTSAKGGTYTNKRRNVLAFDFIAMLTVALLFTAAGFSLQGMHRFQRIYVLIIAVDVLWLAATAKGLWSFSEGEFRFRTLGLYGLRLLRTRAPCGCASRSAV